MFIYDGNFYDNTQNIESNSYLQINSCGFHTFKEQISFRKKGRCDYHILYIIEGTVNVKYNGEYKELSSGNFVLYMPHSEQWYQYFSNSKAFWIHFNGTAVSEILNEVHLGGGIFNTEYSSSIEHLCLRIMMEFKGKSIVSSEKSQLLSFLYSLGGKVQNPSHVKNKISECITFITENFNEEISIEGLKDICFMSRSRFMSLFKERVGMSPHAYLKKIRIDNAKELLESTSLSIAEVSKLSGYNDPLYFSRTFKNCVGVSPKEYKRKEG